MLGWMRRHGNLELCLVLPDGSKSLIPASWTDLAGTNDPRPGAGTLGSVPDLLHMAAVAGGLIHRLESAAEKIGRPSRRRLSVQLSLELSESPAPPGAMWEALAPAERLAVVAALARLMARSIDEKEEEHE